MHKLSIVLFVLLIASCGGGGSNDSPTTPLIVPPVVIPVEPSSTNNTLFSKYNGLKAKANIANSDGHDIAYQISIVADLAHLLSYNNDIRFVRFDSAINDYSTVPINECESGQFIIGELIDNKLDVEYIQCVTGPYTLNGKGKFDGLSINNNGELISATLRFDELQIQNTRSSFLFEGIVKADYGAVTVDSATTTALITDTTSNEQFYLDDLKIGFGLSTATTDYGILGKVFLSPYGYVTVTTITEPVDSNNQQTKLTLSIEGQNQLVIAQRDNGNLGLGLFANTTTISNALTEVPYSYIFAQLYKNENNTVPSAAANFSSGKVDKHIALLFDASSSSDSDFDLLNYQWEVITKPEGALVNIVDNGFVNASAKFSIAGEYQFSLSVDDGELTSSSVILDLYVRQNKPVISLANPVEEHTFASPFVNSISIANPIDDGPFTISLKYAPSSMKIDASGEISWDGKIPHLGESIQINFAVSVSNHDHQTVVKESLILNDSTEGYAFQIDEFPKKVIGELDFNGDGNLELLLLRGSVLEVIDVANNSLVPIWEGELPTDDIVRIEFLAALDSFIVLQDTGQIYQVSAATKSSEIIATADVTDFGFRRIFAVTTSSNGRLLNVLGGKKILNIDNGTVRNVTGITLDTGDINGDGVLDYITTEGIYRSDDMSRIYNTGSLLREMNFLSIVDFDSDGKDEIFAVTSVYVDRDTTRYDLVIFDLVDDELALKQTITGTTNGFSYGLSADGEYLHTIVDQKSVATYRLNTQKSYERLGIQPIEGINLESPAGPSDIPFQPCDISSASTSYILVLCGGRIPGKEVFDGYYSRLDLQADSLTDDVFYDANQRFEGFGNTIVNPDGGFSVGQSLGVLLLDRDFKSQKISINNLDSFIDQDQLFFRHSNDDTDINGWNLLNDKLTQNSLLQGQQFVFHTSLNGSISEFEFFSIENEGYIAVRSGTQLVIVRRADLQEVATLFTNGVDANRTDIHAINRFQQNGIDNVVLWIDNKLFFMRLLDGTFSIYNDVAIPQNDNLPFGYDFLQVLSVDSIDGTNQVQLIRPSLNEGGPNMNFSNFEHVSYSLDTELFEFSQTETRRYDTLFPGKSRYCLANGPNSVRPVAYVITADINVDADFIEQDRERPAKIVALDLASGEMIWSSVALPPDERVAAINLNIACFPGLDSQRLVVSTLQTLSVSH
ncbi:MAG: hypothetical protein ACI88A_002803 [Paraglaciecola sp.]|jgi:hypothetical protein